MSIIPSQLDEVTVGWLQHVLDPRVQHLTVTPIAAGDGFVGQLARLAIDYAGDHSDLPRSLIAKLPAADDSTRQIGTTFGLYERESRFYEELAPQVDLRTPKVYVNLRAPETASFALLMEDLHPARVGGKRTNGYPRLHRRRRRSLATCRDRRTVPSPRSTADRSLA